MIELRLTGGMMGALSAQIHSGLLLCTTRRHIINGYCQHKGRDLISAEKDLVVSQDAEGLLIDYPAEVLGWRGWGGGSVSSYSRTDVHLQEGHGPTPGPGEASSLDDQSCV